MRLPSLAAALALGTVVWAGGSAASPTKTSTPTKSVRTTATVRKTSPATATTARKPATATSTAHKPAAKSAPVARTTWRNRQTAPTTDRYREIQEALVARGYLSADDANGAWGAASSEALKKFQVEQTPGIHRQDRFAFTHRVGPRPEARFVDAACGGRQRTARLRPEQLTRSLARLSHKHNRRLSFI